MDYTTVIVAVIATLSSAIGGIGGALFTRRRVKAETKEITDRVNENVFLRMERFSLQQDARVERFMKELTVVEEQIRVQDREISDLRADNDKKDKKIAQLEYEIASLNRERMEWKAERNALLHEIQEKNTIIERLVKEYEAGSKTP